MSDKFEPFQRVLVRGVTGIWLPDLYGCEDVGAPPVKHLCTGGISYAEIVPYNDETAHLIGTTQPYEPPKPPQVYEFGDKVMLPSGAIGIYIEYEEGSIRPHKVFEKGDVVPGGYRDYDIRPLPDSAAQ